MGMFSEQHGSGTLALTYSSETFVFWWAAQLLALCLRIFRY